MITEVVEVPDNQVVAYNAILKYVVIGNALPNRLQRYDKKCIYASKTSIFLQENKSGKLTSVMH